MVYSHERRQQEYAGYAQFFVSPTAKDQLAQLLREGDRFYDDGHAVRVVAPVPSEHAATSLAQRVERQLGIPVQKPNFVPKQNTLRAYNLEINTETKEAYLISSVPLTAQEIGQELNRTLLDHPEALAHVEAVYVRTDEPVSYFRALRADGRILLTSRKAHRDSKRIPLREIVASGFVVCPLRPDTEPRYHSTTKTLTINNGKQ